VRARDVQLLFADAATAPFARFGAPGQIGEIISAKPQARRRILEDAAGVAGCIRAVTRPSSASRSLGKPDAA